MQQFIEFMTRHWPLFAAFVVVLVALIVNEAMQLIKGSGSVGPGEAVRLINREDALVIDVRSKGDYRKAHILNAKNIPGAQIEERLKELAAHKSKPVIVYCATGSASSPVRDKLRARGFDTVFTLKGGLGAWQDASLPVTSK